MLDSGDQEPTLEHVSTPELGVEKKQHALQVSNNRLIILLLNLFKTWHDK